MSERRTSTLNYQFDTLILRPLLAEISFSCASASSSAISADRLVTPVWSVCSPVQLLRGYYQDARTTYTLQCCRCCVFLACYAVTVYCCVKLTVCSHRHVFQCEQNCLFKPKRQELHYSFTVLTFGSSCASYVSIFKHLSDFITEYGQYCPMIVAFNAKSKVCAHLLQQLKA